MSKCGIVDRFDIRTITILVSKGAARKSETERLPWGGENAPSTAARCGGVRSPGQGENLANGL